jgi:hypothetical protein
MRKIRTHLLSLTLLLLPSIVFGNEVNAEQAAAQQFVPLVGIPYIEGEKVATFGDYVNAFYYASISIAAFLAVIRIIFAGVKYMLTDIVTQKGDAKRDIRAALFGLLIVVGAVLILNTINTNLTHIKLFSDAPVPSMVGDPGRVDTFGPVSIGERLLLCEDEYSDAEVSNFYNTCRGRVSATIDGASSCAVLICEEEEALSAELSCSGNTCTCDSSEVGTSVCVSACQLRPNYLSRIINDASDTVTCTYSSSDDIAQCTEMIIPCCPNTGLATCVSSQDPNICNQTPHPSIPNQTCFYKRP